MTAVEVRLAIDVGSDPIAGQLSIGGAPPRPFGSWLELIAALDEARSSRPSGLAEKLA